MDFVSLFRCKLIVAYIWTKQIAVEEKNGSHSLENELEEGVRVLVELTLNCLNVLNELGINCGKIAFIFINIMYVFLLTGNGFKVCWSRFLKVQKYWENQLKIVEK